MKDSGLEESLNYDPFEGDFGDGEDGVEEFPFRKRFNLFKKLSNIK